MAIYLISPQLAYATNVTATTNSKCQKIILPADKDLVDFEAMRNRFSIQQYSGVTIGKISIINLPVFNLNNPDENNFFYRFINNIHIPTKHDVVRRHLLFKKGDVLIPRLLIESERILRKNSFLSDAIVLPHQRCGNSLDVIVVVRDLWTLLPKLYMSRKGGNNEYGLILEDENIFGTGNALFIEFINDPEREAKALGFRTKLLFGTRISLNTFYSDNTDGFNKMLEVIRPFYSLDTTWSYGAQINQKSFDESLEAYELDLEAFEHEENDYHLFVGYSAGLNKNFTRRYYYGFSRTEDKFNPVDETSSIPENRILAYPWLKYSIIEDNFVIYKNLNTLYRTEDVSTGLGFSTLLGYADDVFDSELSQWVFSLSLIDTPVKLEKHLLKAKFKTDGFWDHDRNNFVNTVTSVGLSYFWLLTEKQRAFIGLSYDHGKNLAQDNLLPLGGEEGLRGYPSEYLLGERRFLLNLEHRYFFNSHYLNLFRFASVLFLDIGQTSYSENSNSRDSELLTSAGVGIRINSSKTNISKIIHIDLAFPLKNNDDLSSYQLRITADATF
jgi:outer membrane protein assembly factor BamA